MDLPDEQPFDAFSEERIAHDTLERYSGSPPSAYQPFLLITNFPKYVEYFASSRNVNIHRGSMFEVAHCPDLQISILDFKIGSPAAALVVDLLAHLPIRAALLLGMCAGLRRHYRVGDYIVPVAAIRGEGTSEFYFPPEVPAMANFVVQRSVTTVMDTEGIEYHIGISHTTNKRFWEFNQPFREHLEVTRPQVLELECATLFAGSYRYKLPLGALLLISDLPLNPKGIKTKQSSEHVFKTYTAEHVELGIKILKDVERIYDAENRGGIRGCKGRRERKREE